MTVVSAVGRKEESMGAPVVHFEIYGKDASKLQSFYADLFGWEIHADNPMNYGIVTRTPATRASAAASPRATRA